MPYDIICFGVVIRKHLGVVSDVGLENKRNHTKSRNKILDPEKLLWAIAAGYYW